MEDSEMTARATGATPIASGDVVTFEETLSRDQLIGELRAAWRALRPFSDAWVVAAECNGPRMTMGILGDIAAAQCTGVHFRNAHFTLQRVALAEPSSNGEGVNT